MNTGAGTVCVLGALVMPMPDAGHKNLCIYLLDSHQGCITDVQDMGTVFLVVNGLLHPPCESKAQGGRHGCHVDPIIKLVVTKVSGTQYGFTSHY